jgi:hypothetical protein
VWVVTPYARLLEAEEVFLTACGWEKADADAWREPPGGGWDLRVLAQGHAVNSEKVHGVARGTCTAEVLASLRHAEVQYLLESGWTERDGRWVPPDSRNRQRARHRQAVNSQKQTDHFGRRFAKTSGFASYGGSK